MRVFGAILIVAVLVLSIACGAMARRPMSTGSGGKEEPITPPPKNVSRVVGPVVKSERSADGKTHTLTVVLTQIGTAQPGVERDLLLLEPFVLSGLTKDMDAPLGRRVLAWCNIVVPEPGGQQPEGPEAAAGLVNVAGPNAKFQVSDEPDFDLMNTVLKEASSDTSRSMVVDVLIGLPGKRSSRTLTTAVYDISTVIRLKAARELITRDYTPAIEKLTAMLLGDIEDELSFQVDLAEELAVAGHKEGTAFLLRQAGGDNTAIAIAAIRALARTGGADEAAQLEALAESSDEENVANAAAEAATEIEERLADS